MAHSPSRNFVFIGEKNTGKSLLINTLIKYFNYDNFDAISSNVANEAFLPIEKNTANANIQKFTLGDTVYNCVDTPGFCESYGKPQNYAIFREIEAALLQLSEIHAICFVLRASNQEFSNFIEKILRNSLSIFPKKAVANVFFIFTHANECHFTSGTGASKIKQIIRNFETTYNATIRYSIDNICLIDNLGMRWLIARKNRLSHPPLKESDLRACWNESKKQLEKMISFASELPGITRDEIEQCRILKEIAVLLRAENIPTPEAQKLQHVLMDGIFKVAIILKMDNSNAPEQTGNPISITKLIEGLRLIKRAIKSEELKQKIDELGRLVVIEHPIVSELPASLPIVEDPIHEPIEPILPIIIPHHPPPRQATPPIMRPEVLPPQPAPRFQLPPPPPPLQTPQADYIEVESEMPPPPSRQIELLYEIHEGIKDNCEQKEGLVDIYASELRSIQLAVNSSPSNIDFKDLNQALRTFQHNPDIGSRTKNNIREFLEDF